MDERIFFEQTDSVNNIILIVQAFFIILFTNYTFIKIVDIKNVDIKKKIIIMIISLLISSFSVFARIKIDRYHSVIIRMFLCIVSNIIILKKDMLFSITSTILAFVINEALFFIAGMIAFIPNAIFRISNDYIAAITILIIYVILIYLIFKIRKLKYGINFLQRKLKNQYFSILIVNACIMIIFLRASFPYVYGEQRRIVAINIVIFLISILFFIKQSFDMIYKQNLLEKDLTETKAELEATKKELEQANKDNIEISGKIHTLNHRQNSLKHQLEKLMNSDSEDIESAKYIEKQLDSISADMYQEPEELELVKTDILAIDTMLDYMKSECMKNNIKFELQVEGNIHYIVNNLISENELEILLADHIKDAIIAINHSDNSNKSILVRLGKINEFYGLYIYDTGIEFTKEVLEKLGKEPITTHKDEGGTGMGFMNTFNTLNETKASLIIKEIGEPTFDNYTKAVIIRFDNKNEFKVESYKQELEYTK